MQAHVCMVLINNATHINGAGNLRDPVVSIVARSGSKLAERLAFGLRGEVERLYDLAMGRARRLSTSAT
jgi:hypothetical protein